MSTSSAASEQPPAQSGKTKVEKAHSYLALFSTIIGVLGAVGTIFVWLATTFFLGDVQIRPSEPVDSLIIKVIDKKGQVANYFGKDVQLLPGHYHLEICTLDQQPVHHAEVDVKLWQITPVAVVMPAQTAGTSDGAAAKTAAAPHKRWWQFWKKHR